MATARVEIDDEHAPPRVAFGKHDHASIEHVASIELGLGVVRAAHSAMRSTRAKQLSLLGALCVMRVAALGARVSTPLLLTSVPAH